MTGFIYRHRVSFADTNVVGNVYFARYLDWQGRCRELFLSEHAMEVARDVAAGRLVLVTLACDMQYFEECYAFDDLDVEMTLREVAGNRMAMHFDYRRDDVVVARGGQTVACMRRCDDGLAPVPVPGALAEQAARYSA